MDHLASIFQWQKNGFPQEFGGLVLSRTLPVAFLEFRGEGDES